MLIPASMFKKSPARSPRNIPRPQLKPKIMSEEMCIGYLGYCWWFRNPEFTSWYDNGATFKGLLPGDTVEEILHQLRLVVFPIIYKVLNIPGELIWYISHYLQDFPTCWVVVWDFWTINSIIVNPKGFPLIECTIFSSKMFNSSSIQFIHETNSNRTGL